MVTDTAELVETARRIAEHLPGWVVVAPEDCSCSWVQLRCLADGAEFSLGRIWNDRGRLEVHGVYPRHDGLDAVPYGVARPVVRVSSTREPQAVAKDLERRFLGPFLAVLEQTRARVRELEAYERRRRALADRLIEALGGLGPSVRRSTEGDDVHVYLVEGSGDFRPSDGDVTVELYGVSAEVAVAVARLLGTTG